MSKIIPASASGGIVTADGVPVPAATILSKGTGQSSGILVIDGEKAWYIPTTVSDLEATLTQVISALGQVKTALDKVVDTYTPTKAADSALAGFTTNPSSAASALTPIHALITANGVAITAASTAINTAKTQLETLKGQLK